MSVKEFLSLPLVGGVYKCEIIRVPLEDVAVSAVNPRVPDKGLIDEDQTKLEEEIKSQQGSRYKLLRNEIVSDGALREPPFVQKMPNGKYKVREGATRITASKEIVRGSKAEEKPAYLTDHLGNLKPLDIEKLENPTVHVYPDDMQEDLIIIHLGKMHINSKGPWEAYQKAGEVRRLKEDHDYSHERIAEAIGISKGYVPKYIWAWKALQIYHNEHPEDLEWTKKFSHFEKLYSVELRDWIGANFPDWKEMVVNPDSFEPSKHFGMFMVWLVDKKIEHAFRISSGIGLKDLIFEKYGNKNIYEKFQKSKDMKLNDALQLIRDKETKNKWRDDEQNSIQKAIDALHEGLGRMQIDTMKIYRTEEGLRKIKETAEKLKDTIKDIEAGMPQTR